MSLPADLQEAFSSRLTAARRTPQGLRDRVQAHRVAAEQAHTRDPLVDVELAIQLAQSCLALLDQWPTFDDRQRAHVQAACLWFAETEDADADFTSLTGFDDDARVLNHVARLVGRPDLVLSLDG